VKRLTFHLIPHTHWDREWYLPRAAFQARLVPVLDEALGQLERNPEARFVLDGQTILLEDYLAVRPGQESRIAALVRRGALEIGPWYVLSDLLIPSGESLRRNLAEGARDAARFGKRLDVLYSPDAFGHPAELPRLAAEFGLRWAVVRRGLGRPLGRDLDLYRWEAAGGGGESVLVHHLPAGGYDVAIGLADPAGDLARTWAPIRRELVERAVTKHIAVFLGADHHAMVPDVSGLRARLQALETAGEVRVSGLREYFEAVERARANPPVIRGELRRGDGHTWVLQDVHATRSRMKRMHTIAELALCRLVPTSNDSNREGLTRLACRTLLECQFHDTLAGTTIDEVQREQEARLGTVDAIRREIEASRLRELSGHDPDRAREQPERVTPRLVLYSPSSRLFGGILTAELTFFRKDMLVGAPGGRKLARGKGYQPFSLASPSGEIIPVQVLAVRPDQERIDATRHYPDQGEVDRVWVAFRAPALEAGGVTLLEPRAMRRAPRDEGLVVQDGLVENRFVSLTELSSGGFALTDKRTGETYSNLCELRDEGDRGDLYTISRTSSRRPTPESKRPVSWTAIARGPLVAAVQASWSIPTAGAATGELGIRLVIALYADSPIVRLRLDLENRGSDHLLSARFPIGVGGAAVAGAPFGVVRRKREAAEAAGTQVIEQEPRTAPAHRFAAVAERSRGLAVLAPGFFAYERSDDGTLAVTLIRSVGQLSRGDLPERPGHAAWPIATPLAQEHGRHVIDLAVVPVTAKVLESPERLEVVWEAAFPAVRSRFVRDFCGPTASATRY